MFSTKLFIIEKTKINLYPKQVLIKCYLWLNIASKNIYLSKSSDKKYIKQFILIKCHTEKVRFLRKKCNFAHYLVFFKKIE